MTKASGCPSDETPPPDGQQMVQASWTNVTFEEFATKRTTFFNNNSDALWNPWEDEDPDAAARAEGVVGERHLLAPGPTMSHESRICTSSPRPVSQRIRLGKDET